MMSETAKKYINLFRQVKIATAATVDAQGRPQEVMGMAKREPLSFLNKYLLDEMPEYRPQTARFPQDKSGQRRLLRSLMNIRPPMPLRQDFLAVQDEFLTAETVEKGIVDAECLPAAANHPRLALWQGDITRLKVDAIVNAANSALLGCFCPCHGCIDNAIHSAAGLQLRDACNELMQAQGHPEPTGRAKLTRGYNLPAKYVLHKIKPVIIPIARKHDLITQLDRKHFLTVLLYSFSGCFAYPPIITVNFT